MVGKVKYLVPVKVKDWLDINVVQSDINADRDRLIAGLPVQRRVRSGYDWDVIMAKCKAICPPAAYNGFTLHSVQRYCILRRGTDDE